MRVENCKTCRFWLDANYCMRFPGWISLPSKPPEPHWCGEWRPSWDRLCRSRRLVRRAESAVEIGGVKVLPAFPAHYDYCCLAPKHESDHCDLLGKTWTDAESAKENSDASSTD